MGRRAQSSLYLQRKSYRRRRMLDTLRILPLVGLWLWSVPALWPSGDVAPGEGVAMSTALTYVFLVWLGLVIAAGFFAWILRDMPREDDTEGN